MSDEREVVPFDTMFSDSSEVGTADEAAENVEQDQEPVDETPVEEPTEQDEKQEASEEVGDEPADEEVNWEEKYANEEKRRKDTQKWANDLKQQNAAILAKIEAGEELSAEDIAALKEGSIDTDNPMAPIMQQFEISYPILKEDYVARGEDPDTYVKAFDKMASQDVLVELQSLPSNKQVSFILSKGKEFSKDYSLLEKHNGSISELIEAAKKEAISEYKKGAKEAPKQDEAPKGRPKVRGTSSSGGKASKDAVPFNSMFIS